MDIKKSNDFILSSLNECLLKSLWAYQGYGFFVGRHHVFITDNKTGEILRFIRKESISELLIKLIRTSEDEEEIDSKETRDRALGEAIAEIIDSDKIAKDCPEVEDNESQKRQFIIINASENPISGDVLSRIIKAIKNGNY